MNDVIKKYKARRDARLRARIDEFNENDHPRDENGRFASGGGGGSAPKKKGGGKSSGENLFYMGSGGKKWDKEAVSKKFQERGYGKRTADKMAEVEIKEVLKKQKENWGTNDMEREAKRKSTEGGSTGGREKEKVGRSIPDEQFEELRKLDRSKDTRTRQEKLADTKRYKEEIGKLMKEKGGKTTNRDYMQLRYKLKARSDDFRNAWNYWTVGPGSKKL